MKNMKLLHLGLMASILAMETEYYTNGKPKQHKKKIKSGINK
jgi:hypothetical protein